MNKEEKLELENELLMTCSKAQAINKYIDELEENTILTNQWYKSQQENKQLKKRIEYLERSVERQEEKSINNYNDYIGILTNWNKLKEYVKENCFDFEDGYGYVIHDAKIVYCDDILDKMQKLENGDNNEK